MNPRYILIKSQNSEFMNAFLYQLREFHQIRFFYFKINGFHTVTIQCYNYYSDKNTLDENKLYGSYIFLYSVVAILLADLLLIHYEHILTHRMLSASKIKKKQLSKLSSISALLLDENSPFEFSTFLYKHRKRVLLDAILKNFRKRNFIFVDYFLDFNAPDYRKKVLEIVEASIAISENKSLYQYVMNFIFPNSFL